MIPPTAPPAIPPIAPGLSPDDDAALVDGSAEAIVAETEREAEDEDDMDEAILLDEGSGDDEGGGAADDDEAGAEDEVEAEAGAELGEGAGDEEAGVCEAAGADETGVAGLRVGAGSAIFALYPLSKQVPRCIRAAVHQRGDDDEVKWRCDPDVVSRSMDGLLATAKRLGLVLLRVPD